MTQTRAAVVALAVAVAMSAWMAPVYLMAAPPVAANAASGLFEFHAGFWINLHHFLYEEAVAGASTAKTRGLKSVERERPDDVRLGQGLTDAERTAWARAVGYYRHAVATRDLLLDDGLVTIKNRLEDVEGSSSPPTDGLPAALVKALEEAAPVYRAHWWPEHHELDRQWIDAVRPLLRADGAVLARELPRIYDTPWQQGPIRVDVSAYANWAGAYTTREPARITIASGDVRNQRTSALEILFHEASHTLAFKELEFIRHDVEGRHQLLPRRDLWHAIIFYTAGDLVAREVPGYQPYADREGLWKTAWPGYREVLDKDWRPHIEGKVGFEAALRQTVSDVLATAKQE